MAESTGAYALSGVGPNQPVVTRCVRSLSCVGDLHSRGCPDHTEDVGQVRKALYGNSDGAVEACRVLLRHAALCAVDPAYCPTCSAIVEATDA